MKYFVIGKDGSKYGPADTATLSVWRQEGRLNDDTWLEQEGSGTRFQAREVIGQSQQAPPSGENMLPPTETGQNPHASPYPRQEYVQPPSGDDGKTMIIIGWVLAVLSIGCCPPFTGGGAIILGSLASKKGHPGGKALIIAAIIMMISGIIIGIVLNLSNPLFQDFL